MHIHLSGMHEMIYCLIGMEKIWSNGLPMMTYNVQIMENRHIPTSERGKNTPSTSRSTPGYRTDEQSRNLLFRITHAWNTTSTGTTSRDLPANSHARKLKRRSQNSATTRLTDASSTRFSNMLTLVTRTRHVYTNGRRLSRG